MDTDNFTKEEREFIAFSINHFGSGGHPQADSTGKLDLFEAKYAARCLNKAARKTGSLKPEFISLATRLAAQLSKQL